MEKNLRTCSGKALRGLATLPPEGRRGQRWPSRFSHFSNCRGGFLNEETDFLNLEIVFLNLEFVFLNLESDLLKRVFDLLNFGGRGFRLRHLQIWVVLLNSFLDLLKQGRGNSKFRNLFSKFSNSFSKFSKSPLRI